MPITVFYNNFYEYLTSTPDELRDANRLLLDFSEHHLGSIELGYFRDALLKKPTPPLVIVYFLKNLLLSRSAKILLEILTKCPDQTFELNLAHNYIGSLGAEYLAPAIAYARDGFKLNLYENDIRDAGANCFALSLDCAPLNFELNLAKNRITTHGASSLASYFSVVPTGFQLSLSENDLHDLDSEFIDQIGNLPEHSALDISKCKIGKTGLLAICNNLCSLPNHFTLDLSGNALKEGDGDTIVSALIEQLSSPDAPEHLTLNLGKLGISDVGGHLLLEMINNNLTAEGLRLLVDHNTLSDQLNNQIEAALHKKDTLCALWRCFAFNFGTVDQNNLISLLPNEILNHIYQYIFPAKNSQELYTHTEKIFNFFHHPQKRKASAMNPDDEEHLAKKSRREDYYFPNWDCRMM